MAKRRSAKKETPNRKEKPDFEKKKRANAKPGSKTRICKTYKGRRKKMKQKIVKQ